MLELKNEVRKEKGDDVKWEEGAALRRWKGKNLRARGGAVVSSHTAGML